MFWEQKYRQGKRGTEKYLTKKDYNNKAIKAAQHLCGENMGPRKGDGKFSFTFEDLEGNPIQYNTYFYAVHRNL